MRQWQIQFTFEWLRSVWWEQQDSLSCVERVLDPWDSNRVVSGSLWCDFHLKDHGRSTTAGTTDTGGSSSGTATAADHAEQAEQRTQINQLGAAVTASGQAVQGTQQVTEQVVQEVVQQVQKAFQQGNQTHQEQISQIAQNLRQEQQTQQQQIQAIAQAISGLQQNVTHLTGQVQEHLHCRVRRHNHCLVDPAMRAFLHTDRWAWCSTSSTVSQSRWFKWATDVQHGRCYWGRTGWHSESCCGTRHSAGWH